MIHRSVANQRLAVERGKRLISINGGALSLVQQGDGQTRDEERTNPNLSSMNYGVTFGARALIRVF